MRMRTVAVVVVASSLLGAVTGSVLGWASAPEPPDMGERRTWLAGRGRVAQEMADRYIGVLTRFVVDGLLIGGLLGGAVGVAGVLLVIARNPPPPVNRERRPPDYQERALAEAARRAAAREAAPETSGDRPAKGTAPPSTWGGWKLVVGCLAILVLVIVAVMPANAVEDTAIAVGQLLLLAVLFYAVWGSG